MQTTPDPNSIQAAHLAAALQGDSQRFSELTEPFRRQLQVHCYRILGSLHEAEDMVQETMLRAWKRLETYEGRASFRSWLYKIATNACMEFGSGVVCTKDASNYPLDVYMTGNRTVLKFSSVLYSKINQRR